MSVFSRLANLARGQVSVMRKRWNEPDPPVADEVEDLEAARPEPEAARPAEPPAAPEDPAPRDLSAEPPKKRL